MPHLSNNVDLGRIRFDWKGVYDPATLYVKDDVVESQGASYICVAPFPGSLGVTPSIQSANWDLMAQGGDVGATLTTQGDLLYRDINGLQRIGVGSAGEVLKVNSAGTEPEWGESLPSGSRICINRQELRYTSGSWTNTTSMSWVPGLYQNYAPLRSDTLLEFQWGFTVSRYSTYDHITEINMAISEADGTNISYRPYRFQESNHSTVYQNTWTEYTHEENSWGAGVTKRFGLLSASHNSSTYRGTFHATTWNNYNQSGVGGNAYPYYRIYEWRTM